MLRSRGRVVVIESLTELDRRLALGARRLTGWRLTGLDLTGHRDALRVCDTTRTTFVGCSFAPGQAAELAAHGALVLPGVGTAPVDTGRDTLYTADDLYDTAAYAATLDARTYAWCQSEHAAEAVLARVLHDQAIDDALARWRDGRRLVGVMGGHAAQRGESGYHDAARLGWLLGHRLVVATGGGPGAMEAANLGARMSGCAAAEVGEAVTELAAVPSFRPSVESWVAVARRVAGVVPEPGVSLGVPTWHYGHEPPNVFATAIAKYFRNALREAILLEVCDAGIVFLPGAGGTVQEIFQDACENYYAEEHSVAPMVLVGREYWTQTLPAWPLLRALARGRPMEPHIHLVDTVEDAAGLLQG
ncbi:Rossmann fold nucleotide-binding protein [Nocardioides sp. BGMRC 2183]|nr:Rossmann fold nucleotide-binding protein [Nocardioides sp. BGMRC 2183]